MARGNKAHRDAYVSIPAEAKEMLRYIIPAVQHMPKADRVDGVGAELKRAAFAIIREFHMAYYAVDPKVKADHVSQLVGWYGHLQAAVEIACLQGVLQDTYKLSIAMRMERIEEGILKWNNAQSALRQDSSNAPSGPTGSADGQGLGVKGGGVSFTPASDSP